MALERIDILQKNYEEHANQARQHENQRAQLPATVLSIAAAVLALITFAKISLYTLPLSLFLIVLGIYGWIFSKKQYERNRFHTKIMKSFRTAIDDELLGRTSKRTTGDLRNEGVEDHFKNYPEPDTNAQKNAKSRIARMRLSFFWECLHITISLIGFALVFVALAKSADESAVVRNEVKIVNEFSTK